MRDHDKGKAGSRYHRSLVAEGHRYRDFRYAHSARLRPRLGHPVWLHLRPFRSSDRFHDAIRVQSRVRAVPMFMDPIETLCATPTPTSPPEMLAIICELSMVPTPALLSSSTSLVRTCMTLSSVSR